LLQAIGQRPLLDMDMRLGEGSAAALAVPILKAAAALSQRHGDLRAGGR